jgi:DNA-binding MarR family transcriptional regulator
VGYNLVTMHVETTPEKNDTRAPRELVRSTAFLLKRLGWACKDKGYQAFDAVGTTPLHYGVLAVLDEGARETQATIADALGFDRSALVSLLDDLEEKQLVERRRDPADRRRHLVSLTPAGEKVLREHRVIATRLDAELLAPLEQDERDELHRLLAKLAAHHDKRYAAE